MQGRSWMAALILAAASAGTGRFVATAEAGGAPPVKQKVVLQIRLDGLAAGSGAQLVIKPGHRACKFAEVVYSYKGQERIQDIPPIDVESLSADRDCSFAITLKEPGQPDKVFRRSLQLAAPSDAAAGKPQVLQCYLSSQAVAAKAAAATPGVAAKPAPPAGTTQKR